NKPFVLVNRFISGINNYVVLNDERGGEIATEHLINLGHTRIANITGPLYTSTGLARFQGFRKRLKKGNITFNPSYVQESEHTQENGYISMKKLLELPEPPTAVFVANIIVCLELLRPFMTTAYPFLMIFLLLASMIRMYLLALILH